MKFNAAVPLDQIQPPERSDKLHPYENEDDEEWEEFRQSVGAEPNKPLEVAENGPGYELIDGDRRYRALTENEADTVACFILEKGEDLSERERESEKTMRMITANEFRKDSDPKQKARSTAKLCAPWLLPSGERMANEPMKSQTEMAEEVGVRQPTISRWLNPLRDEYPLRDALADKASGNYPDIDAVHTIDETQDLLLRGGEDGSQIVPKGQETFVANEIADMQGVGLNEIRNEAEKAAQDGWDENRLLKTLRNNYAYDETEAVKEDIEKGNIHEDLPAGFEDTTIPESGDEVEYDEVDESTENEKEQLDLRPDRRAVNLEELVDGNMVSSAAELKTRKIQNVSFEDEAAQLFVAMKEKTGMSDRDLMEKFVEPIFVDNAVAFLQDDA